MLNPGLQHFVRIEIVIVMPTLRYSYGWTQKLDETQKPENILTKMWEGNIMFF